MTKAKRRTLSIRMKLFLGMAALMLATIGAIGLSSYQNAANITSSELMTVMESALNGVANDLDNRLKLAVETAERIAWSADVRAILSKPVDSYAFSEQLADFRTLERVVAYLSHDVFLFIKSDTMISRERTRFYPMEELDAAEKLTASDDQLSGSWWAKLPVRKLNPTVEYRAIAYLCNVRDVENVFLDVGAVAVSLPEEDLRALLEAVTLTPNTTVILTDEGGDTLLQSGAAREEQSAFYTLTVPLSAVGWRVVAQIPKSDLSEPLGEVMSFYVLLSIAVLAVVLLLSLALATSVTKRLSQLAALMRRQGGSESVELSPVQSMDEVGVLQSTYNEMLTDREKLIDELYIGAIRQRDAELKALEAQINPHFLYNTLDTINWMALEAGAKNISDMITSLARFFRLSLNKSDGPITVGLELEHARLYLELQGKRMGDALQYEIDVPSELYALDTLKLTIQPLVENALVHGIQRKKSQSGTIRISGRIDRDCACLFVEDDGPGISRPEELLRANDEKGGYGLRLTDQRIKLAYGAEYGLHFDKSELGGAKVIVRLPLSR